MTESAGSLKPSAYRGHDPFAFVSYAHADSKPALAEAKMIQASIFVRSMAAE